MGCNIELESITNAMKARDVLKKNKIKARIEKTMGKNQKGCSYSIVTDRDCDLAVNVIEKSGIKISAIS